MASSEVPGALAASDRDSLTAGHAGRRNWQAPHSGHRWLHQFHTGRIRHRR